MIAPAENDHRTILFSGRLIPQKGCRWFIENVLSKLSDDIELEVAGTVWDEGERAALDVPRVSYLGRLDQSSLWRRASEVLCVIVPNIEMDSGAFEGFGLVAVEAAASGGVVVASRHGGLVDAVKDGETGFLVAPGDVDGWVKTITMIADCSPEQRTAFIKEAKEKCETYYSWTRVAADTARSYDEPSKGS